MASGRAGMEHFNRGLVGKRRSGSVIANDAVDDESDLKKIIDRQHDDRHQYQAHHRQAIGNAPPQGTARREYPERPPKSGFHKANPPAATCKGTMICQKEGGKAPQRSMVRGLRQKLENAASKDL